MVDERPDDAPEDSSAVSPSGVKRVRWVEIGLLGVVILCALAYQAVASRRSSICIVAHDTLSGPSSTAGREAVDATQIYIDEVNRSGGVDGHPIEIVQMDDQGYADTARDNVKQIADSSCLAVLGHRLSTTSLAGVPRERTSRPSGATSNELICSDSKAVSCCGLPPSIGWSHRFVPTSRVST